MNEILFAVCYVVTVVVFGFLFWHLERAWHDEREKLLDRIQSGSFSEYKAQERADSKPFVRKEQKDPVLQRLEREPWA